MPKIILSPSQLSPIPAGARLKVHMTLDVGPEEWDGRSAGTSARLVVYDIERYLASEDRCKSRHPPDVADNAFETTLRYFIGGSEQQPANYLLLPPRLRNPAVEANNGVLLVADLILAKRGDRGPTRYAKDGCGWWYVNQVIAPKWHANSPYQVDIVTNARRDDLRTWGTGDLRRQPIASFGTHPDQVQSGNPTRLLAFRLISRAKFGTQVVEGSVLLSSLNEKNNPVGGVSWRPRAVRLNQSALRARPAPGGSGMTTSQPAEPSPRNLQPDLTGLYEELVVAPGVDPNAKNYIAPAALWLHQVGHARVGWYYSHRENGLDVPNDIHRFYAGARFCFRVEPEWEQDPDAADAGFYALQWCPTLHKEHDSDPTVLVPNVVPPVPSTHARRGRLTIEEGGEFPVITLWLMSDSGSTVVGRFRRSATRTRLPWMPVSEADFPAWARDYLVANNLEPMPTGWLVVFWDRALGRHLPEELQMARTVELFTKARMEGNRQSAMGHARHAGQILADAIWSLTGYYLQTAREWIKASARMHRIVAEGVQKPLSEWLTDMVTFRLNQLLEDPNNGGKTDEQLYHDDIENSAGWRGFGDFGFQPEGRFAYTFKFEKAGLSHGIFLQGALGAFRLTLTLTRVDHDAAMPEDVKETELWKHVYFGYFFGIGAGFGFKIETGEGGGGGTGSPVSCRIKSFSRLEPSDFNLATFTVVAIAGPGFDLTVVKPTISSSLFEMNEAKARLCT